MQDVIAEEDKPKLLPSVKKIKLVQYIGGDSELPFATFSIRNGGNATAENLFIYPTELVNKDEIRFVGNTDRHIFNNFHVTYTEKTLEPNETLLVAYRLKKPILNEGTYEGVIQMVGNNFDTVSLDVEIEVKHNPWFLFYSTIAGVGVATGSGYFFAIKEKKREYKRAFKDDSDIISHVNGHIEEWNTLGDSIMPDFWKKLSEIHERKKRAIEEHRDKMDLDPQAEAVKWYDTITPTVHEQILKGGSGKGNPKIESILKPEDYPEEKKREYEKRLTKEAWKRIKKEDFRDEKKWLYAATAYIVAIPTSMFVADNFIGLDIINYLIAFGTGFGVYRVQDIRSLFFRN